MRGVPDNEINRLGGEPSAFGSSQGIGVAEGSVFQILNWVLIMDPSDEFDVRLVSRFEHDL